MEANKRNKILGTVAMLLTIAVCYGLFYYYSHRAPAIDDYLTQWAKELNQRCPMPVDNTTQLDSVRVADGKQLVYNYTVTAFAREEMDVKLVQDIMHQQILTTISINPDMKVLRDYKTSFLYNYKDRNGVFLFSEAITPSDYKTGSQHRH